MAGDPQIELRLTRLANDTTSIYEILGEMSSTLHEHTRRFDGIETTLAEVVRRLPEPS